MSFDTVVAPPCWSGLRPWPRDRHWSISSKPVQKGGMTSLEASSFADHVSGPFRLFRHGRRVGSIDAAAERALQAVLEQAAMARLKQLQSTYI